MNKNLIVDLDGVVVNYDFPHIIKKHFDVDVTSDQAITSYSIEDCLGVPSCEIDAVFKIEAFEPPKFVNDAIRTLGWLIVNDWQIIINSNRVRFMGKDGLEMWLAQYGIPNSYVLNGETPPPYVSVAIDDYPTKLCNLDNDTIVGKLLLFDRPWNRSCLDIKRRLTRVYNWKNIMEELNNVGGYNG